MIVRSKTKVRVLILLAGLFVLVGGAATVYFVRNTHVHQYYMNQRAAGIQQYQQGDYNGALVKLGPYIRREESLTDPEAIYAFAQSRRRVEMPGGRHLAQAMTSLQRVLALGYKRLEVQRDLLELYNQLGYNMEAVELADKILHEHKDDLQALRAKARAQAARQQSEEARKVCEHFNELVPLDLEMRVLSLEVLRDLHRQSEGLNTARDLLAKNPNNPSAELIQSIACSFMEELTAAQADELVKVIKTNYPTEAVPEHRYPINFASFFAVRAGHRQLDDLVLVRYLIEQLDRTRNVSDALAVLRNADAKQETPWLRQLLIRRLWEAGLFADVLKRMENMQITTTLPSDIEFLAIRGISQARTDQKEPAAQTINTLASIKGDPIAHAWATVIDKLDLLTDDNARQVVDAIRPTFQVQRNNAYLRFFYGLAKSRLDDNDAAMDAFQQAAAARPYWQLPLLHLSRLKLETGQKQEAFEEATAAFNINQGYFPARLNYIIVRAENTDLATLDPRDDLIGLVTEIQTKIPGEESTLPIYVQILAKTKRVDEAKKAVNDALASKTPLSSKTLLRLAAVSRDSNLGLADACIQAAGKTGLTPEIAFARAASLAESGQTDEALKIFQDAMPKSAADVSWRLAWASLLEQIKDDHAAATWIALADDPALKSNLAVQQDALAAASTQKDQPFLSRTIDRIRAIAGDDSLGWKMAQVRLALRDPAKAKSGEVIKSLKEIVTASPSNVEARVLLASACEKSGDITAAVEHMTAARKLQPASRALNLELARLYMAQLDYQRAREIVESITPASLDPAQRRGAARLAGQLGNIKLAIEFLESVQADAPAGDRLYLAELYRRFNLHDKAAAIYQSLLTQSDRLEVIMTAADYYTSRGQNDLAMAALSHLEKISLTPAEKDYAMAEYSSRHGKRDEALAQYLAVVQHDPSKPNGWRALITEYIRSGKIDEAVLAAHKAIAAVPADSNSPFKFQNVIDSAASLKALAPEKTLIGMMLGVLEPSPEGDAAVKALPIIAKAIAQTAKAEDVTAQLRPIADTAPRLVPLQMLLVQNYLLCNKPDEAVAIALRTQSVAPASAQIAQNAAAAIAATGRWAAALAPAQKWRELTPENPLPADLFIADLHRRLEDHVSVLADLKPYIEQARANPKDLASVNVLRAQALLLRGDERASFDLLSPLLPNYPQMRAAFRDLAQFLPNPLMEKWIERLAATTPADAVDEQINLAICWHALFAGRPTRSLGTRDPKHKQAAVAILDRLATTAPDHPYVIQARAILAESENRLGAAEQGYRRALELKPDLPICLNNLANMIAERGDLKEALSLAQRAVSVSPREASVRDTLADLQLKLKDYPNALNNYKAARQLEPKNINRSIKLAQACVEADQLQELAGILDEIDKMLLDARTIDVNDAQREAIRQLRNKVPKTASR